MIVIKAHSHGVEGQYLEWYDPEAFNGGGDAVFTYDRAKAKTFTDTAEALVFIMQQPKKRPIRTDGLPNRPIMMFTLEIVEDG
jgi:hypothetical protein